MEKVTIELFGLTLLEPNTFIFNVLLTIFSLGLYRSLRRLFPNDDFQKNYSNFFLFMGLSTITGGCAHLLGYYLPNYLLHSAAWSLSAAAVFALQRGSVYDYPANIKNVLNKVFLVQLVVSIGIYFGYQLFGNVVVDNSHVGTPGFQAVMISTAIGFLGFILPLHLIKFVKEKDNGSAVFLMGMVISLAAPLIQSKGWGISAWFNHNDVAHIILAVCYYIYYLSIRLKVQQYNAVSEGA